MTNDPVRTLAAALVDARAQVEPEIEGRGQTEADRAMQFVLSAYDLAIEMWFQKGDPSAPRLTNWGRPWRKYGGDNPTTTYLSAPVAPGHSYRLQGDIGNAVYVGVQAYTRVRASTPHQPTSPTPTCSAPRAPSTSGSAATSPLTDIHGSR